MPYNNFVVLADPNIEDGWPPEEDVEYRDWGEEKVDRRGKGGRPDLDTLAIREPNGNGGSKQGHWADRGDQTEEKTRGGPGRGHGERNRLAKSQPGETEKTESDSGSRDVLQRRRKPRGERVKFTRGAAGG